MNRRIRAVAVAVGAVLAAGLGGLLSMSSARAATTLVFNEHLTNEEWVYSNGMTSFLPTGPPAPGDRYFLRFDLSQGPSAVGFVNVQCAVIFNGNSICTGVSAITNRGDIVVTGLIRPNPQGPPQVFDLAVTGGTFAYRGVHGDAHVQASGPGDQTITFNLV